MTRRGATLRSSRQARRSAPRPGPIVDAAGRVVGRHGGDSRLHHRAAQEPRRRARRARLRRRHRARDGDGAPRTARQAAVPRALLDELALAPGISLPLRCEVAVRYRGQTTLADVARPHPGGATCQLLGRRDRGRARPIRRILPRGSRARRRNDHGRAPRASRGTEEASHEAPAKARRSCSPSPRRRSPARPVKAQGRSQANGCSSKAAGTARSILEPTFFAAQPNFDESLMIRVQRGDGIEEVRTACLIVVEDVNEIRQNARSSHWKWDCRWASHRLAFPIVNNRQAAEGSLALYLQETLSPAECDRLLRRRHHHLPLPVQRGSQRRQRRRSLDRRRISSVRFADPRKAIPGSEPREFPPEVESLVGGNFNFYFQRGQPAQRFP